jgi:putative Ca2+/H+ antiporter (TMEM165/GDT1 family)
MELKLFFTVFAAIFIAELGDKTQLATLLFSTDNEVSKLTIFFGSSAALILTSALGVAAGSLLSQYLNVKVMAIASGTLFIAIGVFSIYKGLSAA